MTSALHPDEKRNRPDIALTAMIPDVALPEFQDVTVVRRSFWTNFNLHMSIGYVGAGRRMWVARDPSGSPILVEMMVEQVHCARDAHNALSYVRPSTFVVESLRSFSMGVTDSAEDGLVTTWKWREIHIRGAVSIHGPYIVHWTSLGRDEEAVREVAAGPFTQLRNSLPEASGRECSGAAPAIWQVAKTFGVIFGVGIPAYGIFPDSVAIGILGLLMITLLYLACVRGPRMARQRHLQMWRDVVTKGDNDGTTERALATIGFHVPPEEIAEGKT